ncbi:MAG: hypothetical protein ACPGOV_16825 [Magnetovibrionaceae bacterium]
MGRSEATHSFNGGNLILADRDRDMMATLRDVLAKRGFERPVLTDRLTDVAEATRERMPDLVICDADAEDGGFTRIVSDTREGLHGENPYLVTVGITADPDAENIRRLIDAGVDCILLRPFSVNTLLDRISSLVHRRKDFAVTSSYIGPDRRVRPRQEVCLPLIRVPNTLADRANNRYDPGRLKEQIALANRTVNRQRTCQDAVLVMQIVEKLGPLFETLRLEDSQRHYLAQLDRTARDIAARMEESADSRHVAGLCHSLVQVTDRLKTTETVVDPKDVSLLRDVALAVSMAFDRKSGDGVSQEIAAAISGAQRFG